MSVETSAPALPKSGNLRSVCPAIHPDSKPATRPLGFLARTVLPLLWLGPLVVHQVIVVAVARQAWLAYFKAYRRDHKSDHGLGSEPVRDDQWWTRTMTMVDHAYLRWCERRGLNPYAVNWVTVKTGLNGRVA